MGLNRTHHYNLAIAGESGAGKSTLVNLLRGLPDTDVGAAPVSITEVTNEALAYDFPQNPCAKLWDLPGAATSAFPAAGYADRFALKAFNCILVLVDRHFTEVCQLVNASSNAGRPFAVIRTKADQAVDDLMADNDLSKEDTVAAVRTKVTAAFERTNFERPAQLFIISARYWRRGDAQFDEVALLRFLTAACDARK
jgi:energy-coupling factor transporter ATP-binding protein EcfA2